MDKKAVRTIRGTGEVEVDYDKVLFTVISRCEGETGALAKANLAPTVRAIETALDDIQKKLGVTVIDGTLRRSNHLQPNLVFDPGTREQRHEGYTLTHLLTFATGEVDKAGEIQNLLTDVGDSQVNAPAFRFSDPDAHYAKLFDAALKDARRKFQVEAALLGLKVTDYEIVKWGSGSYPDIGDERAPMIATASLGPPGGSGRPMDIQPGKARLTLTIPFTYAKK